MEPNVENCDLGKSDVGMITSTRMAQTCYGQKSNKCNQCEYASSNASNIKRHLKTHSGEKTNKCNQCDFAFSRVDVLRRHLKTHSEEK